MAESNAKGKFPQVAIAVLLGCAVLAALGYIAVVSCVIDIGCEECQPPPPQLPRDPETLCLIDAKRIPRHTYILVDASEDIRDKKPLLTALINDVSKDLETEERLSVSTIDTLRTEDPMVFCNPHIPSFEEGKRVMADKHCEDIVSGDFLIPRQIPEERREHIRKVCEVYVNKNTMIKSVADNITLPPDGTKRSYIIRAIEDIAEDYGAKGTEGSEARLVVFSDMLQNAPWFSQYPQYRHGPWTIGNLKKRREYARNMQPEPEINFAEVLLCYLPNDLTRTARARNAHRGIWRRYFSGSCVVSVEYTGCAVAAREFSEISCEAPKDEQDPYTPPVCERIKIGEIGIDADIPEHEAAEIRALCKEEIPNASKGIGDDCEWFNFEAKTVNERRQQCANEKQAEYLEDEEDASLPIIDSSQQAEPAADPTETELRETNKVSSLSSSSIHPSEPEIIPATCKNTVPPKHPRRAKKPGWVLLTYDVSVDGSVVNVDIKHATERKYRSVARKYAESRTCTPARKDGMPVYFTSKPVCIPYVFAGEKPGHKQLLEDCKNYAKAIGMDIGGRR